MFTNSHLEMNLTKSVGLIFIHELTPVQLMQISPALSTLSLQGSSPF